MHDDLIPYSDVARELASLYTSLTSAADGALSPARQARLVVLAGELGAAVGQLREHSAEMVTQAEALHRSVVRLVNQHAA